VNCSAFAITQARGQPDDLAQCDAGSVPDFAKRMMSVYVAGDEYDGKKEPAGLLPAGVFGGKTQRASLSGLSVTE
jgi:hypothetical protein